MTKKNPKQNSKGFYSPHTPEQTKDRETDRLFLLLCRADMAHVGIGAEGEELTRKSF